MLLEMYILVIVDLKYNIYYKGKIYILVEIMNLF